MIWILEQVVYNSSPPDLILYIIRYILQRHYWVSNYAYSTRTLKSAIHMITNNWDLYGGHANPWVKQIWISIY